MLGFRSRVGAEVRIWLLHVQWASLSALLGCFVNDSTKVFFKKLNIYLVHIYKGGEETESNIKDTPHPWMARPLTPQSRRGWKGQDLCCILELQRV